MNSAELKKRISENGFYPVPVLLSSEDGEKVPRFDGTLDEFLAAAKAISVKAILLSVVQLEESDFERSFSSEGDSELEEYDNESEEVIRLEEILPSISKYRKHLGLDGAHILKTKGGCVDIDYLQTEPWWDEFQNDAAKALEIWRSRAEAEMAEENRDAEERSGRLLGRLRELIADKEFCGLRTQRAMLAYAYDKIPDLIELGDVALKPEIQELRARIEARGLNRKI